MPTKSKLRTTIERVPDQRCANPVHPGEMLREEFLIPLGLSSNALALAIGVSATRVGEIVNERRGITADTALRLGAYFRMGPDFWMNLQKHYELEQARDAAKAAGLARIEPAPLDAHGVLLARTA